MYNVAIYLYGLAIKIASLFNQKAKFLVEGRKNWEGKIKLPKDRKILWIHSSSLGEYEQGLPVLEKLKNNYFILQTFSSPSGYRVAEKQNKADLCCYLPIDTPKNATKFLDLIKPDMVIFVKYDFWHNILKETNKRNIPIYLISAKFRESQVFFKFYGGFFRKTLNFFNHIFVQDENSFKLLAKISIKNVSLAGDTRFDRVLEIKKQDNKLSFMNYFCRAANKIVVLGSVRDSDEKYIKELINHSSDNVKFVYVPHEIESKKITRFVKGLNFPIAFYNDSEEMIGKSKIVVVNCVGLLTKIYSYGNIAYVGGGFTGDGVHNVLEPAVFACSVLCGANIKKYVEATMLKKSGGLFTFQNYGELKEVFDNLLNKYNLAGDKASLFVNKQSGATDKIINYINKDNKTN